MTLWGINKTQIPVHFCSKISSYTASSSLAAAAAAAKNLQPMQHQHPSSHPSAGSTTASSCECPPSFLSAGGERATLGVVLNKGTVLHTDYGSRFQLSRADCSTIVTPSAVVFITVICSDHQLTTVPWIQSQTDDITDDTGVTVAGVPPGVGASSFLAAGGERATFGVVLNRGTVLHTNYGNQQ